MIFIFPYIISSMSFKIIYGFILETTPDEWVELIQEVDESIKSVNEEFKRFAEIDEKIITRPEDPSLQKDLTDFKDKHLKYQTTLKEYHDQQHRINKKKDMYTIRSDIDLDTYSIYVFVSIEKFEDMVAVPLISMNAECLKADKNQKLLIERIHTNLKAESVIQLFIYACA